MPISRLDKTEIVAWCEACKNERTIKLSDVTLGVAGPRGVCSEIIHLPPCSCEMCNEAFLVTFDHCPIEGWFDDHRRAVNSLALMLEKRGQVISGFTPFSSHPVDVLQLDLESETFELNRTS